MDRVPIYEQIAQWVRQEVLNGRLRPGDMLPTVREMAERWDCTPGTAQQAYKALAQQGLAVTRPGQGTRIGSVPSGGSTPGGTRLMGITWPDRR